MKRVPTWLMAAGHHLRLIAAEELCTCGREATRLLRSAGDWFQRYLGWWLLVLLGMALAIALAIHPHDETWLQAVRATKQTARHTTVNSWARTLSHAGDFLRLNGVLVIGLILAARKSRQGRWRRLAVMCLISSTLSGLSAVSLRFMLGRARPIAHVGGGFYGPDLRAEYQGCPSGHSATAFGAAVPFVIAEPRIGVPMLGLAGGVAWSRMYLNQHFPADVAAGLWVALWFGVPLGWAARSATLGSRHLAPRGTAV